ncbi:MAG: carboxypeptidase-like regulatory domain-containing protein [Candidatus Brocadia sp.]|uniref:Cna protein B-type domain protein n=1 Tax=Candidatus Brocadia fulgida TaxID=380242 RepID=A0A0M2UPA1_9BACT|nr:MAG: hypothetical protein BROFUL_03356 [Candidatus Brocadia fulgida]UJS19269.1 MAG: carboxypeptidase-like regulatory domain-containing protein [Candidatus Brocadia sp.]
MKSRYVFFVGGGVVLCLLLSMTVAISKAYAIPGTVSGTVRDDFEKDGYETSDPPLSPNPALRPSMRLLIGSNVIAGPVNRTPEGMYTFAALPGNYTVEASCSGFVTQTQPVTIISGGGTTKNFGLQRP